jgi:hypothetical protein
LQTLLHKLAGLFGRSFTAVASLCVALVVIIAKGFPLVKQWMEFKKLALEIEKLKVELKKAEQEGRAPLVKLATLDEIDKYGIHWSHLDVRTYSGETPLDKVVLVEGLISPPSTVDDLLIRLHDYQIEAKRGVVFYAVAFIVVLLVAFLYARYVI